MRKHGMARRRRPVKTHETPSPQSKPSLPVGLLVAVALTLMLGGVPFALGTYIELNSPDPFDGGAYVYSARHLLDGARLWVDEHSSAQPGTLLMNVLGVKLFGFSDLGPNVMQMLLQIGALGMLFYTARRLFGNSAAVVSTSLAAIMLSAPVIAKFGNVKEQFMIPFMIVAACAFALHETGGRKHWAVIAGAAAIIPFYFKATGLSIVVAMGIYLAVKLIVRRRQWKAVFTTIGLWIAGAIGGLCFPAALYIWQDGMDRFLRTFPVILVEALILFSALAFAAFALYHHIPWRTIARSIRSVNRRLWIGGGAAIIVMLLIAIVMISTAEGVDLSHDIPAYLRSVPFVRLPRQAGLFVRSQVSGLLETSGILEQGGYVGLSRQARSLSEQAPQVLRYYHAVGAAIYPALAAVLLAAGVGLWHRVKKKPLQSPLHAVAALLALWWLVDMIFVWISPHSYEQYYLPPVASGAMLTAYAVWLWHTWLTHSENKTPPAAVAGVCGIVVLILIFPVFAGFSTSPDTGAAYQDPQTGRPQRRRGFAQSLETVKSTRQAPWQAVGSYIRDNSDPRDTLYVWGWFPGIYVQARRMAPVPRAYESQMHVSPPDRLARQIETLISQMEDNPPRYIVDSRKRHFPFDRPPFDLWPIVPANMFGNPQPRLLSGNPQEIEAYERAWSGMLQQQFGPDEAQRFEAMKPFRDFVMTRYRLVRQFGNHMLFEHTH